MSVSIGARVKIGKNVGTVRYVGEVHYAKGEFAGVELDEAVGKNNGSVKGQVYFECPPKHGVFTRVGDVDIVLGEGSCGAAPLNPRPTAADDAIVAAALEAKKKGNGFFAKGDFPQATVHYNEAIELDPTNATFFSNRSACFMEMGDPRSALADAVEARRLDPSWSKGHYREGKALQALGDLVAAAAAYREAAGAAKDDKERAQLERLQQEVATSATKGGARNNGRAGATNATSSARGAVKKVGKRAGKKGRKGKKGRGGKEKEDASSYTSGASIGYPPWMKVGANGPGGNIPFGHGLETGPGSFAEDMGGGESPGYGDEDEAHDMRDLVEMMRDPAFLQMMQSDPEFQSLMAAQPDFARQMEQLIANAANNPNSGNQADLGAFASAMGGGTPTPPPPPPPGPMGGACFPIPDGMPGGGMMPGGMPGGMFGDSGDSAPRRRIQRPILRVLPLHAAVQARLWSASPFLL